MSIFNKNNPEEQKNIQTRSTTIGKSKQIELLGKKIYSPEEIKEFDLLEAINTHPLASKPINIRSKLAYSEIIKNTKPTKKYLLPGQLVCFYYRDPKFKEDLDYYDQTPLVLFCGITKDNQGNIREVGFNLHYYPPFARARIYNKVYQTFKQYFWKNFNEVTGKPNMIISYKALMRLCKTNAKIGFGIRMYIPVLRGESWVIPTRLFATSFYTEGHFAKQSLIKIQSFWRRFRP